MASLFAMLLFLLYAGREEEGGTRSIVSAIKVVKINKDGFNGTLRNRSRLDRYTYMHCGGNHARLTGRK